MIPGPLELVYDEDRAEAHRILQRLFTLCDSRLAADSDRNPGRKEHILQLAKVLLGEKADFLEKT